MKRKMLITTLVLVSSLFPLLSDHTPLNLSVFTRNDSIHLGVGYNADDLRSYGFAAELRFSSSFLLSLEMNGFTLRDTVGVEGERFDEFAGLLSYELNHDISDSLHLATTIGLGVTFSGDLGLQTVQNRYHELRDLPIITLSYDREYSNSLLFTYEISNYLTPHMPFLSPLSVSVAQQVHSTPGYETVISGGLRLQLVPPFLSVATGYTSTIIQDSSLLHTVNSDQESGIFTDIHINMGIIRFQHRYYPQVKRSWGSIGITTHAMKPQEHSIDLPLSFSMSLLLPESRGSLSLKYSLSDTHQLIMTDTFFSRILNTQGNVREQYGAWLLGIEWQRPHHTDSFYVPFVSLLGGVRHIQVYSSSADQPGINDRTYSSMSPHLQGEAGCRFFTNERNREDGFLYSLEIAAGLAISPGRSSPYEYELRYEQVYDLYIRTGIVIELLKNQDNQTR